MYASTKRARREDTDGPRSNTRTSNCDEELQCQACGIIIPGSGDYVQNSPCSHIVCTLCVVKSNMQRGSNPACCQVESCSNRCTQFCQYFNGGSPGEVIRNKCAATDDYAERFLPVEFLKSNHSEEMNNSANNKEAFVLYGLWQTNKRECKSICKSFTLEKGKNGHYFGVDQNERALSGIKSFFKFLHPIVVEPSRPVVNSPTTLCFHRVSLWNCG